MCAPIRRWIIPDKKNCFHVIVRPPGNVYLQKAVKWLHNVGNKKESQKQRGPTTGELLVIRIYFRRTPRFTAQDVFHWVSAFVDEA